MVPLSFAEAQAARFDREAQRFDREAQRFDVAMAQATAQAVREAQRFDNAMAQAQDHRRSLFAPGGHSEPGHARLQAGHHH